MMFEKFYIDTIIRESSTIKSFYLRPKRGQAVLPYLPGQFVTIKVQLENGETVSRNYTISDKPNNKYYRLTIKRESEGRVSRYFHNVLKVGSEIEMSHPMGDFYLNIENTNDVVLISGGVGITPMMSMLEYVVANQKDRKVYFLHSSLNKSVRPFSKRLNELQRRHPTLMVSIFHSFPNQSEKLNMDYDFEGFISKGSLSKTVKENNDYFICGPTGFMDAMYDHLVSLKVPESNIFYEFFGEGKKLGAQVSNVNTNNGIYKVKFSKSGLDTVWDYDSISLLDLAEKNGLTPPSSCRMGTCSSCETELIDGNIEYDPEPFMQASEENKIFLCCAKPTSEVHLNI